MTSRLLALLLVLATPAAAAAQSATQPETVRQAGTETLAAPANLTFGSIPGADADRASSAVQVVLDASVKEKVGTAAFGWKTGKRQVQLSFSGPVGATDEAAPVSLTGLGSGAKAKLSMSRMFWRGPNPLERKQMLELCQRLKMLPIASGEGGAFTEEDFKAAKDMTPCRASNIKNPDDRAMYEFLSHQNAIPWMIGFDGVAGQATHKFVQPTTLDAATEKRLAWTLAARAGYYQQGVGFFLATYTYVDAISAAGAPTQICRPMVNVTVAGATRCDSVVVGPPTRKTTSVISGELRRLVSGKLAMSPNVSVDLKENADGKRVWGVEVPLYFLTTTGTANPTGGVRFGWRSDTREVTASVFIGGAFKLFG